MNPEMNQHGEVAGPEASIAIIRRLGNQLQSTPNPHVLGVAHAQVLVATELEAVSDSGLTPGMLQELESRIVEAVEQANSTFLRFDLRDIDAMDEWTPTCLADGDVIGALSPDNSTRKIVIVIPLAISADHASAEVRFPSAGKSRAVVLGEVLMFPAFMAAEVSITAGARVDAFVGYAYGPAFR